MEQVIKKNYIEFLLENSDSIDKETLIKELKNVVDVLSF